jgi:hypothetical protein
MSLSELSLDLFLKIILAQRYFDWNFRHFENETICFVNETFCRVRK